MITKVSKVGDLYQINEGDTPIDITSLRGILKETNITNINNWLDDLDKEGNNTFEITADKGTVVNIYEVDYPTPKNPNLETQEISKHLDEYEDAISQQIFPGVPVEDVVVTTQESLKSKDVNEGRFFNEQELRDKANVKRGWKERLRDQLQFNRNTKTLFPEAKKRAREIIELLHKYDLCSKYTTSDRMANS
ncbi:MAG: hypothetical protein WC346_21790, partial [Methanogenium sp.]